MIVVDSIGNLASKKEVEDALEQKSVGDMTRAKQIKSLFRMVTPHLTLKDIPMVVVNHTYKEIGLYPKDIVGGGTGSYYSADNIYILGRQQEKDGTDLIGYNFIINVEKSRYVREKARIPVTVRFDGGISHYSGLLDMALESGHVTKPNVGWYAKVNTKTGEVEGKKWRLADTECTDFWASIMADPTFKEWVRNNYQFSAAMSNNATVVEEDDEE
jgi:recA bacterial DNA recombination protein